MDKCMWCGAEVAEVFKFTWEDDEDGEMEEFVCNECLKEIEG